MDDHDLLRQYVATGAQNAFETLVQRYTPLVYGVCQRVLGESHAAEDAAQATFLTLVRKAAALARTLGGRPLAGWLHVTAHRTALQARRAQTRRHHHERRAGVAAAREAAPAVPDPAEEEGGSLSEAAALIDAAVAELTDSQREAVLLRYVQRMSQDEVAERLGCARETVHTHVTRALASLRGSLRRQGLTVAEGSIAVVMAQGAVPPGLSASIQAACAASPIPISSALHVRRVGHGQGHAAHAMGMGPGAAVAGTLAMITVAGLAWAALRTPPSGAPPTTAVPASATSIAAPAASPRASSAAPALAATAPVPVLEYRGHTQGVTTVAMSPDGTRAASGSWDLTLQVWSLTDGRQLGVGRGHHDNVHDVAWASDLIATASSDGTAALWAVDPLHVIAILRGHQGRVLSVAISPDGSHVATGGLDGTVRICDRQGATRLVLHHQDGVWGLAFAPDGHLLASASDDKTVALWDPSDGTQAAVLHGHTDCLRTVVFSPDGEHLATGGNDATVRIWSTRSHALERTIHQPGMVWKVSYGAEGRVIAACGDWGAALWDARDGTRMGAATPLSAKLQSVAFTRDGRELATAGADGVVRLWRVSELLAGAIPGAAGDAPSARFAPATGPPATP